MIDFGITGIWCDTSNEFRKEFKQAFNDDTDDTRDGLHTYVFSQYHDNSAYTEVLYGIISNKKVLFFLDTTQYELSLDDKFTVRSFHSNNDNAYMFLTSMFDSNDVHYLDEICGDNGVVLRVFTLSLGKMINEISVLYPNNSYPIDEIRYLSEDEVMEISLDFMEYKSGEFAKQINDAKKRGDPFEGMEENPFQDNFFDAGEDMKEQDPEIVE